jgi:hypothetical protein
VVASAGWALTTERVAKKPDGRDVGHLFDYYLAHGFMDDGRRLIGRPL